MHTMLLFCVNSVVTSAWAAGPWSSE